MQAPVGRDEWAHVDWEQHPVFVAARRFLEHLYSDPRGSVRLVDLGCLEGGFSLAFARLGFDVLGLEVRPSNAARCRARAAEADLPNLRFVEDDARNLASYGEFEVVFCSGLLYHLDQPRAFLELLARQTRQLLILNTHVAPFVPIDAFGLSDLTYHEGLLGRWYQEYASDEEFANRDAVPLSSWDNRRSFWIERTHLLDALRMVGFPTVLEQYDQMPGELHRCLSAHAPGVYDRCQLVALKRARP